MAIQTLASGTSVTLTLAAGQVLRTVGEGLATLANTNFQYGLSSRVSIGPYPNSQVVYLTSTSTNFTYTTDLVYPATLTPATSGYSLVDPVTGLPISIGGTAPPYPAPKRSMVATQLSLIHI